MVVYDPRSFSWGVCYYISFFLFKEHHSFLKGGKIIKGSSKGKQVRYSGEWGFGDSPGGICLAASGAAADGFEHTVITSQLCVLVEAVCSGRSYKAGVHVCWGAYLSVFTRAHG